MFLAAPLLSISGGVFKGYVCVDAAILSSWNNCSLEEELTRECSGVRNI